MLQVSTIKFLKDLKKNNSKEWFDKNRKLYEYAKEDFASIVTNVIEQFGKKEEAISLLTAKDCMFRINRDVRFSKDKSPYKTNMGASFSKGGKKSTLAGYYFHCEPGQAFIGGGLWMPDGDVVKKVRQEIDYSFTEFSKIIKNKKFVAQYKSLEITKETSLSREPKGYEKDNPAIEYIKLKSWLATAPLTDADLTDKNLTRKIITAFEALQPLITFLNSALVD
jgi:uncharacterized protein (TIGR02453 family)